MSFFALSLPFILALLALAIDTSYGFFVRSKLQTSASSAALAAASQLDPSLAVDDMKTAARDEANQYADLKNWGAGHVGDLSDQGVTNHTIVDQDIIFGNWEEDRDPEFKPDTDGDYDEATMPRNAVQVFARREGANALPFIIGTTGLSTGEVHTSAIATAFGGIDEEICLLALNETDPDAIYINGSNEVYAEKCGICSNGGISNSGGNAEMDVGDEGVIIYRDDGPGDQW